jgi:hypothetical protein
MRRTTGPNRKSVGACNSGDLSHNRNGSMPAFDIPQETYDEIKRLIESDDSPVGIDAQKAHVLILHKLAELEERLDRIEERMSE